MSYRVSGSTNSPTRARIRSPRDTSDVNGALLVRYHANETGFTEDADYRVSGSNLTIESVKETMGKLTIEPDGCLHSPTMGELCKPRNGS